MSFAPYFADAFFKPLAWTTVPAAILVFGVRDGLVPLEFDEPRYSVQGRLLVDGAPVAGVEIRLHALPVDGLIPAPCAISRGDGRFSVRANAWQDGAAAGEYRVTAVWRPWTLDGEQLVQGENLLPAEFAKAETTPLRVTVRPGENVIDLGNLPRCPCRG